jgi:hypothetical protein
MTKKSLLIFSSLALLAAEGTAEAATTDLDCNNGIVTVPLRLDSSTGTLTLEGTVFYVDLGAVKIAVSTTDPAGDKIDYVLDRSAKLLTETDHDRMPDGSFKTIGLQFSCNKTDN